MSNFANNFRYRWRPPYRLSPFWLLAVRQVFEISLFPLSFAFSSSGVVSVFWMDRFATFRSQKLHGLINFSLRNFSLSWCCQTKSGWHFHRIVRPIALKANFAAPKSCEPQVIDFKKRTKLRKSTTQKQMQNRLVRNLTTAAKSNSISTWQTRKFAWTFYHEDTDIKKDL